MPDFTREPGHFYPPLETGHRHLTEHVLDPDLTPPAPFGIPEATEVTIYQASVTLTDAQIKALPTTSVPILAPTDILGYSGAPGSLFMPTLAVLQMNVADETRSYTNVDDAAAVILAWGSDQSWNIMDLSHITEPVLLGTDEPRAVRFKEVADASALLALDGLLEDNGLHLVATNGAAGNFTGGNAANTLKVTVWYGIFEV